jgi:hypothetical protein
MANLTGLIIQFLVENLRFVLKLDAGQTNIVPALIPTHRVWTLRIKPLIRKSEIKMIGFPCLFVPDRHFSTGSPFWPDLIEWKSRILVLGYIMGLADPFGHRLKAF